MDQPKTKPVQEVPKKVVSSFTDQKRLKMQTNPHEPSGGSKRRRLIKGAVLVPAIYTLHNGAARAAISNMRCIQATKTQPSKLFSLGENQWHNESVPGITVQLTGGSSRVVLVKFGSKYYDNNKKIWGTAGLDPLGLRLFKAPNGNIYEEVIGGRRKTHCPVYIRVDNRGNIRKRMGPHAKGKAVMDSCWHSFA